MVRTNYKTSFSLRKNVVNKNGESGIFLRLTVNKEAAQISTKATCAIGDWDTDAGKAGGGQKVSVRAPSPFDGIIAANNVIGLPLS